MRQRSFAQRVFLLLALWLFASGSALLVAPARAAQVCDDLDPAVATLLGQMSDNARRVSYSGVVTLQRGNDMQIMELSHQVVDGRVSEQLARLTGQDARVERYGHPATCLHPGHQLLRSGPKSGVCGLGAVYRFRLAAGERVAGRAALRMRVEPRDVYRFGYVFEIDSETALMLKSSTLAADQRVIEQFQFASLSMNSGGARETSVRHEAAHPHPRSEANESDARTGPAWDVAWLPSGFVPTDAATVHSQRKSYTDGLASFSVFLEPLSRAIKPGEGIERQGSTVAYTRGVMLQNKPVLLTVLGEIPTNTARMVADSVRLR